MVIRTHLRIVKNTNGTGYTACEYRADTHLHHGLEIPPADIDWKSCSMESDDLIEILVERGWHPTDIGDELHQARRA